VTEPTTTPIHEFNLLHCPCQHPAPHFDDPRYDTIKASPPAGCTPENFDNVFGLQCRRTAPTLLDAVAEVCAEANSAHGILLNDLGLEKLWEFASDGPNGFGATVTAQLLLMAAHRASLLGYTTDDLTRFLNTASRPAPADG
jgi:hypothetical protein